LIQTLEKRSLINYRYNTNLVILWGVTGPQECCKIYQMSR
jgi:hypothetical protein